jgi:hypothetical protein
MECPRCRARVRRGQNFCAECGLELRARGREEVVVPDVSSDDLSARPAESAAAPAASYYPPMRPRTVRFAGQVIASAISGAVTAILALFLAFYFWPSLRGGVTVVSPAPFSEASRSADGPVNASGIVPIADSRFLVVDDLTDDAFYELTLTPDGQKAGPLVRRPIEGLAQGMVEDLEESTLVETPDARYIIAISSLEKHEGEATDAGLIRVTLLDGGVLRGETMPGFREWLVASFPEISASPVGPDRLDVQGLIWDPRRDRLFIGVRSETKSGKPLVLPVRIKDWHADWTPENLEAFPAVTLDTTPTSTARGIRSIARNPENGEFVVIVGPSFGHDDPFTLYAWNGDPQGRVERLSNIVFDGRMRPEGITYGTIGGKLVAVLVDDNGGYYVLWDGATFPKSN